MPRRPRQASRRDSQLLPTNVGGRFAPGQGWGVGDLQSRVGSSLGPLLRRVPRGGTPGAEGQRTLPPPPPSLQSLHGPCPAPATGPSSSLLSRGSGPGIRSGRIPHCKDSSWPWNLAQAAGLGEGPSGHSLPGPRRSSKAAFPVLPHSLPLPSYTVLRGSGTGQGHVEGRQWVFTNH